MIYLDNHHEDCDGSECGRYDCAYLPENVLTIQHPYEDAERWADE